MEKNPALLRRLPSDSAVTVKVAAGKCFTYGETASKFIVCKMGLKEKVNASEKALAMLVGETEKCFQCRKHGNIIKDLDHKKREGRNE